SRLKGIGRAICCVLAQQKIDIFFTYWTAYDQTMPWGIASNEPALIQAEIEAFGVRCATMELDLTSPNAIEQLFEGVKESLGNPHILVNNATYSTQTNIEEIIGSELDRHYQLNMRATTLLISVFIQQFTGKVDGRIINLTSGQSLGAMPNEIAYGMTKAAIETLTKTIASSIAAKGITINAVNPGPNDTGWMDATLETDLLRRFPMQRIGQPTDIADLIGFLVSEKGAWITGQVIHSEGGFIR
ncbi:MAG: SDR family oxidoreductase, partial [Saprospiraceae bacterium]